jgi:HSP20 family protein
MAKTPTSIPLKTEPKAPVPVGQMPWHPLATLRDEMDRLFDDFFTGWPMTPFRRWRLETDPWRRFQGMFEATFPTADVVEGEKDYNIMAELPGMSEKDIEIALTGDVLTLKGEKKEEHEEKGQNRYVSERRYGSFQRSFQLRIPTRSTLGSRTGC